jgi:hypothetical protein
MLKIENMLTKMRNALDRSISQLHTDEKRIYELEILTTQISTMENQKEIEL